MEIFLYIMFLVDGAFWMHPEFPPVTVPTMEDCENLERHFETNLKYLVEYEFEISCEKVPDIWEFVQEKYSLYPSIKREET